MRATIILLILFSLALPIAAKDLPVPTFEPADCDCGIGGLYLFGEGNGGSSGLTLSCTYQQEDAEMLDRFNNIKIGITSWYDPEDTKKGLENRKYYYEQDKTSCSKNERCVMVKDSSDSNGFIWIERQKDSIKIKEEEYIQKYKIMAASIHGKTPLITINGAYMTDGKEAKDEEVIKVVDGLISCAKASIDRHDPGSVKGKLTLEGRPIKQATIYIDEEDKTTTDSEGRFSFSAPDSYAVTIKLQYEKDNHIFFRMIGDKEPITITFTVKDGEFSKMYLDTEVANEESKEHPQKITDEIKLEEFLTKDDGLISIPTAYVHFTEALEFYTDELGVDLTGRTLDLLFKGRSAAYKYENDRSWIEISTEYLDYDNEYRPFVFYHEFTHYVHHMLTGKTLEGYIDTSNINHGGYANPGTGDSYSEGVAAFMPVIIANHHGRYWADDVDKRMSLYPLMGSLETDWKAWQRQGKVEEYAIAGILWDLVDGKDEASSDSARCKDFIKEKLEEMIADYDMDKDGSLDQKEFVFASIMAEIDSNFNDILEFYEIENLNDTEVISKLKESKDKDGDGDIPVKDLYGFIEEEWGMFEGILKEELGKDYEKLPQKITADLMMERIADDPDDDNVDLELKQVWDIIKRPHKDFTSFYESLKGADEIFIAHGFFLETSEGNGKYDEGEPFQDKDRDKKRGSTEIYADLGDMIYEMGEKVGTASDSGRKERRTSEPLEGEYVKVNPEVPSFKIEYVIYGKDYFGLKIPSETYTISATNHDGLIYVPVSPGSRMTIRVKGADTLNPQIFSSKEFERNYEISLDKGYFAKHEFEYEGQFAKNGKDSFNPMIIIAILAIIAIGIVIFLKKR